METIELIKYFESLGLEVHTTTKARGHHGFFLKNRIDISKNLPQNKQIPTLLHEFAHYIHSKLEPDMPKTGGSIEVLFKSSNPLIKSELLKVTNFVDENSLCLKLEHHKKIIREKIKEQENIIKTEYPKFMRSKRFREFEKYIKKSDARYLLKYDRVKVISGFWKRNTKTYTIDTIENDFTDMPKAFAAYIRLKSYQKKQSKISAKINKNKKYYSKPSELFARFIESLYINKEQVNQLAPISLKIFNKLSSENYYGDLSKLCHKYLHI